MPRFSAFTAFGFLRFSAADSRAKDVYSTLARAIGKDEAFSLEEGTETEATIFADAMTIAAASVTLDRVQKNLYPETAYEKLPAHERAFDVIPGRNATIAQRRAVLAAKNLIPRGSRPEAIDAALRTLLGTDFVALHVTPVGSAQETRWPVIDGAAPGLYSNPEYSAKTIRLLDPVAPDFSVSPLVTVPYENWDPAQPEDILVVDEKIVVECEIPGAAEVVTVLASSAGVNGGPRTFQASFTKAHGEGCSATTRPTPMQFTTAHHLLVVLKRAAALSVDTRREVHELMRRICRGVWTWSIVHEYTDGYGGFVSYQLDVDPLDTNLLATFTR